MDFYSILIYLFFLIILFLGKKYFNGGINPNRIDLSNKVIIITGANSGIGLSTLIELSKNNAKIILACRDLNKTLKIKNEVEKLINNKNMEIIKLDLSDLDSIREFVKQFLSKYNRLDILINNAGVMGSQKKELTKNGFERCFGTNYFGHFLLTYLLLEIIKKTPESRVINVSSMAHIYGYLNLDDLNCEKYYHYQRSYGGSKLANIMFSYELNKKLEKFNSKSFSVHPGVVRTNFIDNSVIHINFIYFLLYLLYPFFWYFTKNTLQGAQTILFCSLSQFKNLKGGYYFSDCKETKVRNSCFTQENCKKLWEITEKILNL